MEHGDLLRALGLCNEEDGRLAMILSGKDSIRDVVLFPALRQKD